MKKSSLIVIATILLSTVLFSSCALKKMVKRAGEIEPTVAPNPLEMHADSVDVTITVKFPEKYFHKKAIVEATPVLRWEGGEKELKKETRQGEAVEDNFKVINFAEGGSVSYTDKIAFEDAMKVSKLFVKLKATIKSKEAELVEAELAPGIIATPGLVMYDSRAIVAGDNFVRITNDSKSADIHFNINQANVKGKELKAEDIQMLADFIEETKENERRKFKGVSISAYASPDGSEDLNTKLAGNRAQSTEKYIAKEFKKVEEAEGDGFVSSSSTPEDWDGFQKLMSSSDMEDARLILDVLKMHSDPEVREKEIKKLSKVYLKLADEILPQLRRSKFDVNIEIIGYSDEEITAIADSKPDSLNVEELLYAASLTDDMNKKLKIYQGFTGIYPKEWRGPNNVGYCQLKLGNLSEAKKSFEAAKAVDNSNSTILNNLAAVAIREGDLETAMQHLESAAGAGKEVSYNFGIISIKRAGFKTPDYSYDEAVNYFGSDCSFNSGLAKLLAGNADGVSKDADCAMDKCWSVNAQEIKKYEGKLFYLKAVAGARQGDSDLLFNNLRSAIEKDADLAKLAKVDWEFGKFFEDETFKSIVK